jgi:DNA-binding beta-propeller fold protein YncE
MNRTIAVLALACPLLAQDPTMTVLGTYRTGLYNVGAAEITAHDPQTHRLFVVNGGDKTIDILDIRNPANPTRITQVKMPVDVGDSANSVAVKNGVVAVAVQAAEKTDPGSVLFIDTNGMPVKSVKVGALPDMLTFTPDGKKVLVANEGEPSDNYKIDPEGSVSIVDISSGVGSLTQANVKTATFSSFTKQNLPAGVRIYGPNATVAQDMEPEYIAVSADSKTAYVTLQENNALAIIDVDSATVTKIAALGLKEHWREENSLDASDRDGGVSLRTWTVWGMYQPDAIAAYNGPDGKLYLLTANEGDARAYTGFNEEARVSELKLDPARYPQAAENQLATEMGRLRTTNATGDLDGDGDFDMIHTFGARSFSVWDAAGQLVWDSANHFETIGSLNYAASLNVSNSDNVFDSRSDDKGPEPEAIIVATIRNRPYAFIANERQSNIMIYDMTEPRNPRYVGQYGNRNVTAATTTAAAGDLGPEGLFFIPAADSPNGNMIIVASNEISGTVTLWQVN